MWLMDIRTQAGIDQDPQTIAGATVVGQIRQILAFSRSPEPKSHYWVHNVAFWIRNGSTDRLPARRFGTGGWDGSRLATDSGSKYGSRASYPAIGGYGRAGCRVHRCKLSRFAVFAVPHGLGAPSKTKPVLTLGAQVVPGRETRRPIVQTSFLTPRTARSFLSMRRRVKHACGRHEPDRQEKACCAEEEYRDKRIAC
jgi:hypothetical protein